MSDVHELAEGLINASVEVSDEEITKSRLVLTDVAIRTGQVDKLGYVLEMLGLGDGGLQRGVQT